MEFPAGTTCQTTWFTHQKYLVAGNFMGGFGPKAAIDCHFFEIQMTGAVKKLRFSLGLIP
jgi:hypothetical protein